MTYRQTQLATAEAELTAARDRYAAAKNQTAKRDAAEDIEFWSNKTAFLTNLRLGAFQDEK